MKTFFDNNLGNLPNKREESLYNRTNAHNLQNKNKSLSILKNITKKFDMNFKLI